MDIKMCEFDYPTRKRAIGGLHPGILDDDVGFRFDVSIKGTDPKDIEAMLKLFRKSARDFYTTWEKKLQELRS